MNPNLEQINSIADPFRRLERIMEILLSPQGCPWDREQTHESLLPCLIEEAYEVREDVLTGNWDSLKHELGDLALQVVFHAALARREQRFDLDGVMAAICDKLIRRHPHVFGEQQALSSEQVLINWEQIKQREKTAAGENAGEPPSILDGLPQSLPALQRAQRMQEKAARVNFDWTHVSQVWAKVEEELAELQAAFDAEDERRFEEELGDLLFALVNLARFKNLDAETVLSKTIRKFQQRFRRIEDFARQNRIELAGMSLEEMDEIWNLAKDQVEG